MPPPPPVLLLDVDGVLNAVQAKLPDGWRRGTYNGFVLSWDPTVTARLGALHDAGRVELQWLTTWTENADALLAEPMGLPRGLRTHRREDVLPTGFQGERRGISGWWKLAANAQVLVVAPDLVVGLTHAELDRVEAWLAEP